MYTEIIISYPRAKVNTISQIFLRLEYNLTE